MPVVCLLRENAYSDRLPIFKRIFCCFVMELCEFFIYFPYKHIIRYMICKYFLLFSRLLLHFVDGFFCHEEFGSVPLGFCLLFLLLFFLLLLLVSDSKNPL